MLYKVYFNAFYNVTVKRISRYFRGLKHTKKPEKSLRTLLSSVDPKLKSGKG